MREFVRCRATNAAADRSMIMVRSAPGGVLPIASLDSTSPDASSPMRITAITLLLVFQGALPAAAAQRSILLLAPTVSDARLEASHEAISHWNAMLADLGVETRLGTPQVVVESPVARALEPSGAGAIARCRVTESQKWFAPWRRSCCGAAAGRAVGAQRSARQPIWCLARSQ